MEPIMNYAILALLIFSITGCGRDNRAPENHDAPQSVEVGYRAPQTGPSSIEGDFAGIIFVDESGSCHIKNGNDVENVTCTQDHFDDKSRSLSIHYKEMGLEQTPACHVKAIGKVVTFENIESIDNTSLKVKIGRITTENTPQPQPQAPSWPDPILNTPNGDTCTPMYNGPHCQSCCGSKYGSAGHYISHVTTAVPNPPVNKQSTTSPKFPNKILFQCKILD